MWTITPKASAVPGRIGWMDYAKTLAIFFVVLLHTHCDPRLTVALNSMVMPTFFFLSGYLFSRERNPAFGAFARKRFRQLVVPYLWINLVAYSAWVLVLRHYGDDATSPLAWHEPLLAIALGLPDGLVHDIPLWSLLCFFVVEMAYYPLSGRFKVPDALTAIVAYSIAAAVSMAGGGEGLSLPLTLAPAAAALCFYALGHFVRTHASSFRWLSQPGVLVLLAAIVAMRIGLELNVPTNFFMGTLGNPLLFPLAALGGIVFTVQVAAWLCAIFSDNATVRFTSRGTLLICGFHLLAFAVIKGVMLFAFHVDPAELTLGVDRGLLMAIAAFLLCLPVVWAVERWAPWLVSK